MRSIQHLRQRAAAAAALSSTLVLLGACGGGGDTTSDADALATNDEAASTASTDATQVALRYRSPNGQAKLAWNASSDPAAKSYRVYYGLASGKYTQAAGSGVAVESGTSFQVTGLRGATLYYFAVTSVDATGRESLYSNEVSKLTP